MMDNRRTPQPHKCVTTSPRLELDTRARHGRDDWMVAFLLTLVVATRDLRG